jgi:hypothetical protein
VYYVAAFYPHYLGFFMQNSANAATQLPVWVPIVASLIGGGAMGALITATITYYRNRRQPVGYKIEFLPVLQKTPNFPSLRAILMDETSSGSGPGHTVENLYLARITVINRGNQDMGEFKYGATLGGTDQAINVISETPDRHHVMTLETPVSLSQPSSIVDFTCRPFNRKEPYIANVYFTASGIHSEIKLSSPHSTKFEELPTYEGALKERFFAHPLTILIISLLLGVLLSSVFNHLIADAVAERLTKSSNNTSPPITASPTP